jgi:hypothetical protein
LFVRVENAGRSRMVETLARRYGLDASNVGMILANSARRSEPL